MPQLKNVAIKSVFSFSLQPLRIFVIKKCTAIRIKSFLRALLVHFNPGNYGSFSKSWIAMIVYRYAVQVFFGGTPGVHFIVIVVSPSQASFTMFYFIISYCVRRRWFFCPSSECLAKNWQKLSFVMVCCPNSKI